MRRRADAMLAAQRALQFRIQVVDANGGQKSEMSQVHGKQRNVAAGDDARRRKQRAIAAQHNHQVGAFRQLFAREEFGVCRVLGRLLVAAIVECRALQATRASRERYRPPAQFSVSK